MIRLSLMRFALIVVVFLLSAVALEDAGVSFANAHTPAISGNAIDPLQPDVITLLCAYLRARTDSAPYLFISNRGVPIDRHTF
jgi:hypothetical protein